MIFCAEGQGCAGALGISFPKSIWFLALCSHSVPKHLYLAMKTSYLHVYLVPTRLLIFRTNSHLHIYLVYTFIRYHGVYQMISLPSWGVPCHKTPTHLWYWWSWSPPWTKHGGHTRKTPQKSGNCVRLLPMLDVQEDWEQSKGWRERNPFFAEINIFQKILKIFSFHSKKWILSTLLGVHKDYAR